MLIVCPLSLVNHFVLCELSKKMRKIKFKREYSIVDFPFFVGKKLPNFEKKTRKKFHLISPLPLWLWLQVATAYLNILI